MTVLGLLLAAGAGRRIGTPKALLRDRTGTPFVARAVGVLLAGGCDLVTVVTGASAEHAAGILDDTGWSDEAAVDVVVADDWAEGMGASLRAGLSAVQASDASCVMVTLVDLPDVGASVVRRMLSRLPRDRAVLARATYAGVPGHPVLLGRDHWAGVVAAAHGDRGARGYLAEHPPLLVECGDLATGRDVDTPQDLRD